MPDTTNLGTPEDVLPGGARPRRSHEAGGQRRESTMDMELAAPPGLNGCGCAHLHLCRWLGISTREVLD